MCDLIIIARRVYVCGSSHRAKPGCHVPGRRARSTSKSLQHNILSPPLRPFLLSFLSQSAIRMHSNGFASDPCHRLDGRDAHRQHDRCSTDQQSGSLPLSLLLTCLCARIAKLTGVLQLWSLYNILPISPSRADVASQKALQREVVTSRAQLRATSSQDEFAKWAKLRRMLDKKIADLEKLSMAPSGFSIYLRGSLAN